MIDVCTNYLLKDWAQCNYFYFLKVSCGSKTWLKQTITRLNMLLIPMLQAEFIAMPRNTELCWEWFGMVRNADAEK